MISEWKCKISEQMSIKQYTKVQDTLKTIRVNSKNITPDFKDIFSIFKILSPKDVKVVILGQDPYPTRGDANGVAFAVNKDIPIPASLQNIFKEVKSDFGKDKKINRTLIPWVEQGVFLLNTVLTTEIGVTHGHKKLDWQIFTDATISVINALDQSVVFILWGNAAKAKSKLITASRHLILTSVHPSPLAANRGGFFGCKHFSKANSFLKKQGRGEIKWI